MCQGLMDATLMTCYENSTEIMYLQQVVVMHNYYVHFHRHIISFGFSNYGLKYCLRWIHTYHLPRIYFKKLQWFKYSIKMNFIDITVCIYMNSVMTMKNMKAYMYNFFLIESCPGITPFIIFVIKWLAY